MDPVLSARLLVALSIVYGATVAVLGAFGSRALVPVAIVGAVVTGGLWALRGVFMGVRGKS
jgi:hypothetical protein